MCFNDNNNNNNNNRTVKVSCNIDQSVLLSASGAGEEEGWVVRLRFYCTDIECVSLFPQPCTGRGSG